MNCRFCGKHLTEKILDLVSAPLSNAFLTRDQLDEPERFYPLKLFVCDSCFLVQLDEYKKSSDIFNSGYVYYSSYSKTWLVHAKQYVEMMVEKYGYGKDSLVVEVASNDGYLLQYFTELGIPSLGIEPAEGTAKEARRRGIETICDFFGRSLAQKLAYSGKKADLLIGNNVLAHVPDLHDFVAGLKIALKPSGIMTLEFPHLMQMIDHCQFDTIYHEHFSYFSFTTVCALFRHHDLEVYDVEEITTHGGSLRIFAKHADDRSKNISANVQHLLKKERAHGLQEMAYYRNFQKRADQIKHDLLGFLVKQKADGQKVAAYGAAAKGNTLLNYCGVTGDLIAYVVDASLNKQGKYLPGSHIAVLDEDAIRRHKPDYVLILPWNIKEEIMAQLDYICAWDGKFVIPIPNVEVIV